MRDVSRGGLRDTPGVLAAEVLPRAARVDALDEPGTVSAEQLVGRLRALGFPPQAGAATGQAPRPWKNPKVTASARSGVLLLAGWLVGRAGARRCTEAGRRSIASGRP